MHHAKRRLYIFQRENEWFFRRMRFGYFAEQIAPRGLLFWDGFYVLIGHFLTVKLINA